MAVFVTTLERSGIDRYSQELAKRLGVATLETPRYRSFKDTLNLFHALAKVSAPIHFPSQHFARYGLFLRKPFIITVHDLARISFPFGRESMRDRVGLKLDALGLKRARHIIAVSACTQADLVRLLSIPDDRITVIYNGVDRNVFKPMAGRPFDFPYLLYVGTERPRKNLGVLLQAFAILKGEGGALPGLKLVKVGVAGRADKFREVTVSEVRRLGLENEVIFAGYVSNEELARYYSSALALIMPSLYEGFGLPLVEAMACGCPVIASNTSSLPEVAGDAGLFFAPQDSRELAHLIVQVATEPVLRSKLIRKGFKTVKHFSWERTARATLQLYQKVEAELAFRRRPSVEWPVPSGAAQPAASLHALPEARKDNPRVKQ